MNLNDDPKMVMVEWEDCESAEGWQVNDVLLEYLDKPLKFVQSVGWLLADDDKYTVLAQSIDREHESGFLAGDCLKIPKGMVKSMMVLSDK